MAVYSIVMKQKNGGAYDTLYPKTTATQVITDTSNRFLTDAERTSWNGKIDGSEKGSNSGVCPLEADGKISVTYLPDSAKEVQVVADITARDALTPYSGMEAYVIDASTEGDVTSGWARYMYDGSVWVKIAEGESVEGASVVEWANITNKPTSSVANIDDAVTKRHTHGNQATLDAITAAFTSGLKTSYDAAVTDSHTHSNSATLDAIEEALTTALKAIYDGYSTFFLQATEPAGAINGDFWFDNA